jgi:TPP-dependent pyruvate/acetoin dehydrogenase alpha subunit
VEENMNIAYVDGSKIISVYDAAKLAAEAARPEFVSAKVYEPGKHVTIAGTEYRVGQAGNLIRIR